MTGDVEYDAGSKYYRARLSGLRLRQCYERAPRRIRRYLDAEAEHAVRRIHGATAVLELGCGYGRVMKHLARQRRLVVGIDTSQESLILARQVLSREHRCTVAIMDAADLGFRSSAFDAVVCVQNGICAFRVDPEILLLEALRVVRPGGLVLLSSYAESFWPHRLEWFELQSEQGLIGEIDRDATHPGEIICKDGFRSATFDVDRFTKLCEQVGAQAMLTEVDESSLFCEIKVRRSA